MATRERFTENTPSRSAILPPDHVQEELEWAKIPSFRPRHFARPAAGPAVPAQSSNRLSVGTYPDRVDERASTIARTTEQRQRAALKRALNDVLVLSNPLRPRRHWCVPLIACLLAIGIGAGGIYLAPASSRVIGERFVSDFRAVAFSAAGAIPAADTDKAQRVATKLDAISEGAQDKPLGNVAGLQVLRGADSGAALAEWSASINSPRSSIPLTSQNDPRAPAEKRPAPGGIGATTSPPRQEITPELAASVMKRGDTLMELGDVVAARYFYEVAASGGLAHAATAIGRTYDPVYLRRMAIRGVRGSSEAARQWYQRGFDAGDTEAQTLLDRLESIAGSSQH